MERFFSEQNLKRYRQLANGTLTAAERRRVFTLLEATCRDSPLADDQRAEVVR